MDAFDSLFGGKEVKGSVRRKSDDGISRSVRLVTAPAEFTLDAFAAAAVHGATFSKRGTDRGAALNLSRTLGGAAAKSAVLALGDADPVPPAVKERGKNKTTVPETNGAA